MPTALQLQADFERTLRVLFVAPADTREAIGAFASAPDRAGSGALWTDEAPLRPTTRYPAFALLDPRGRILLEGSTTGREEELRACLRGLEPASP